MFVGVSKPVPLASHFIWFENRQWRRWRFMLSILFITAISVIGAVQLTRGLSAAVLPPAAAVPVNQSPASVAPTTPITASIPSSPAPAVTVTNVIPVCTPATYDIPSKIELVTAPAGITQQIDPVTYYTIFGITPAQVHDQLLRCAPRATGSSASAEFAAQTSYSLTWRYDTISTPSGLCVISNVKVGLHVTMILPQWQPTTTNDYAPAWQTFSSNLLTHENGHNLLNQQYARQLLINLQTMPAMSCQTVSASAQAQTTSLVAALNAANEAYDVSTNHGATQGAIIP